MKKQVIDAAPKALESQRGSKKDHTEPQKVIDELHRQIGKLTVEVDWLKKNLRHPVAFIFVTPHERDFRPHPPV